MPTYEYVCSKCGQEFEQVQSISDPPLRICPEAVCARKKWGRGRVKRKISAGGGLLFKGSGFYITDYRSEGYKQAAKKETEKARSPDTGGKSPAGAEAKPAAKSESKPAKSGSSKG